MGCGVYVNLGVGSRNPNAENDPPPLTDEGFKYSSTQASLKSLLPSRPHKLLGSTSVGKRPIDEKRKCHKLWTVLKRPDEFTSLRCRPEGPTFFDAFRLELMSKD
jgi:hypothetical protein